MNFFVNHNELKTDSQFTLGELVYYFSLKQFPIAIELNQVFIPKSKWNKIYIKNFDKIEIVTIVGGG